MIVMRRGAECLFVTQPDHAALACDIMQAWHADGFAQNARRDEILFAVREHDNGWTEEDRDTQVDEDGRPVDFMGTPLEVKHRIWPRAVARVGRQQPYAAALIAQHAVTVHAPYRDDAGWDIFFKQLQAARAEMLARVPAPPPPADSDYRFVRTGDLLSLVFCNRWLEPHDLPGGERTILTGATLEVSPDPFAGARVPLRIRAKRLPDRRYGSAAVLREALAAAPVEIVEGVAIGAP